MQRQLQVNGFNAREGQIIDASIVRAPTQHNTAEEQEIVKQRSAPIEWEPAKRRQKDVEARWTKKYGKSYFGYKLSVSVDKGLQSPGRLDLITSPFKRVHCNLVEGRQTGGTGLLRRLFGGFQRFQGFKNSAIVNVTGPLQNRSAWLHRQAMQR